MNNLDGATALLTGGSGGLGRRIAAKLAERGVRVAIAYRSGLDRAEETARVVADAGGEAITVHLDIADETSSAACVEEVVEQFGGLDILINNAGMASGGHDLPAGDLDAFTPAIFEQMMKVNVTGPYVMVRAAASHLRASKWGRIVNLGSTLGHGDWGTGAAYAPSKAAVVPLTRFLATALAPDITVNCVAPGLMEGTVMSGGAPDAFVSTWRDRALSGQTTNLDDVAAQVVLMCEAETMTGQTIVIDGGIHFS